MRGISWRRRSPRTWSRHLLYLRWFWEVWGLSSAYICWGLLLRFWWFLVYIRQNRMLVGEFVLLKLVHPPFFLSFFFCCHFACQRVANIGLCSFFSYFTNLSFIGIASYFLASGVQTLAYTHRRGWLQQNNSTFAYPLQGWPLLLQFLHRLLWSTITTFRRWKKSKVWAICWILGVPVAIIVSVVFWTILAGPNTFSSPYLGKVYPVFCCCCCYMCWSCLWLQRGRISLSIYSTPCLRFSRYYVRTAVPAHGLTSLSLSWYSVLISDLRISHMQLMGFIVRFLSSLDMYISNLMRIGAC